jgi:hypothetical protein
MVQTEGAAYQVQWARDGGFNNPIARPIMAISLTLYLLRASQFQAGKEQSREHCGIVTS